MSRYWITLIIFPVLITATACTAKSTVKYPNIVFILADDLGYGDVSSYNPNAAWQTIHIDRIASEGMMFTDAHTGSAVCSPTRYGVLTGRYAWRTRLKSGVLWSWDEPLIDQSELTVSKLLKEYGYTTACIGKWHLGLGWQYHNGTIDSVDFSLPVTGGPTSLGFDYFFGITASLDIPPYVWIEDDLPTTVPTSYTESTTKMGWWRKGLTGEDFDHQQVLSVLTEKAVEYIERQSAEKRDQPFFLYFPLTAPHTPILPNEEFRGKSGTNDYGDFVLQVDHTVGEILRALDRNGISNESMVIFTSDNGCSPQADFDELATFGHDPSFIFRGYKADIFEGGHRVPFIVRWPGKVTPGSRNEQVICLTDLIATVASVVQDTLDPVSGVDSYSLLPSLLGDNDNPVREATVHHSINGSFAIRKDKWKLIMCPGSGGWSFPRPGSPEADDLFPIQLYDLESDPGETKNIIEEFPDIAKELKGLLESYILSGRSTSGPVQKNTLVNEWPGLDWISGEARKQILP